MYSTWIFDLDGTLVDSFNPYFVCLADMFAARGVQFKDEHRHEAITDPLPVFLTRHLGKAALQEAFAELQRRSNDDAERIVPFEGVPALLKRLKDEGKRVAVWTNRDLESAELILKHSGLGQYVEYCVSRNCVENPKPHPEGMSRILARLDAKLASVTMVGDHDHDMLAAKAAGARAVRASWHTYWPVGDCAHADHQFRSVPEFAAWIS